MSKRPIGSNTDKTFHILISGDVGEDVCVFQPKRLHPKQPSAAYKNNDSRLTDRREDTLTVPSLAAMLNEGLQAMLLPAGKVPSDDVIKNDGRPPERHPIAIHCSETVQDFVDGVKEKKFRDSTRILMQRFTTEEAGKAWRISQRVAQANLGFGPNPPAPPGHKDASEYKFKSRSTHETPDLIMVADAGGDWRKSDQVARDLHEVLLSMRKKRDGSAVPDGSANGRSPLMVVDIDGPLPELTPSGVIESPVWQMLLREFRQDVVVICSSRQLRHEDAAISRHLSWELSVETLCAELRLHRPLKEISQFGHVIIRFGCVAGVYVHNGVASKKPPANAALREGRLVFAPLARDGVYRDRKEHGDVAGYKITVAASLAAELAQKASAKKMPERIAEALRSGLLACMRMFDKGYPVDSLYPPIERDPPRIVPGSGVPPKVTNEPEISTGAQFIRESFAPAGPVILWEYEAAMRAKPGKPGLGASSLKTPRLRREQTFGIVPIPPRVMSLSPSGPLDHFARTSQEHRWRILDDGLRADSGDGARELTAADLSRRINIAMAIGKFGHDEVLNRQFQRTNEVRNQGRQPDRLNRYARTHDCITLAADDRPEIPEEDLPVAAKGHADDSVDPPEIYAPLMEFGDLVVIERDEMEDLRSIRNAIKEYAAINAEKPTSVRPISMAVFGPPGTGKSFAVKQVVEGINRSNTFPRKLTVLEYNVAQFRSTEDLESAAQTISNANQQKRTPLVFFDEFDCGLGQDRLGWLKFFLAPMQDGFVYGSKGPLALGPAILVFAGGTHRRFDEFVKLDPAGGDGDEAKRQVLEAEEFRRAKGPDFVSRLSAHVNILPIDREPKGIKQVVRRAMLVRSMLQRANVLVEQDGLKMSAIDDDILYALLTVDRYRHGVRSMETLLANCIPLDGRIEKASLPAHAQLNMYVDAEEFLIRMYRGRIRRSLATKATGGGK